MSPWSPEGLRVALCPQRVLVQPWRRSLFTGRRPAGEERSVHLPAGASAGRWKDALSALADVLPAPAASRVPATVILSNQWVLHAVVPWRAELASAQENLAYARYCFTQVYGKDSQDWELRLSDEAPGRARIATAVAPSLLEELRAVFSGSGARVVSIQPHLMAAFNAGRRRLRHHAGAWIVLEEPGHLCFAMFQDRQWASVHGIRITGPCGAALAACLDRESLVAEVAELPRDVYLGTLDGSGPDLPEVPPWRFHALAAEPSGSGMPSAAVAAETPAG